MMKFRLNHKKRYIILASLIILTLALIQAWLNYNSPENRLKRLVKAAPEIAKAYQLDGVSLKLGQTDPNGLLVQVGSPKAKEFLPELNISKWQGEVNFRMSAASETETHPALRQAQGTPLGRGEAEKVSPEKGSTPSEVEGGGVSGLNFEGEKIKYNTSNREYEFYQSISTSTDGAGYNFDVLLKAKPASNIFTFNIETQNLDFFYQPALNQEKQKELSSEYSELSSKGHIVSCTETDCVDKNGKVVTHRPENVVGSYAVYYKGGKSGDFTALGGKNYMAGKAFHIYRPQIIDAQGNKVWGELKVDEAGGKLTVTIPQDFLDSAAYPVTIDPTFGYSASTCGASGAYEPTGWTGYYQLDSNSPSGANTLTHLSICMNINNSADTVKFGFYSEKSGPAPNSRLAYDVSSWAFGSTVTQFYTNPVAWNYSLTANTQYWGAYTAGQNADYIYWDSGGTKIGLDENAVMPATTGTLSSSGEPSSAHISLYAIYSAASPTNVYYSVGQNAADHKVGSPTVTISSGVGTFSVAQTASTTGVGDAVTYGGAVAYISGKQSQTTWTLITASGQTPSATTSASVSSIAHAFDSLSMVISGASAAAYMGTSDLTASGGGYILNIPCYYDSGPDIDKVNIGSYTTDSTHYIKIYTPSNTATEVNRNQRHNGKWDDTKYHLDVVQSGSTFAINIQVGYVRIDGLQIYLTVNHATDGAAGITSHGSTANGEVWVSNSIIKANVTGSGNTASGIENSDNSGYTRVYKLWNNIVYGFKNGSNSNLDAIYTQIADNTTYAYNNTVYNNYYGIRRDGSGTVVAKNNLAQNDTSDYAGSFDAASANNISQDATSPNSGGTDCGGHSCRSQTVNFADKANNDYHLASTDTSAKGAGTNLYTDSNIAITTDIDGQARPAPSAGGWDIGADQFVALPIYRSVGPGPNTSALASSTGATMTIDNNTATFSTGLANNIGVGDVIVYNGYSTAAKNSVAFISGRASPTSYAVQDVAGRTASSTYASTNWQVFRAYTSLCNAMDDGNACTGGTENSGIPSALSNFDTWSNSKNLASTTEIWNVACYGDAADSSYNTVRINFTTATSTYVRIYTPYLPSEVGISQRHSGKWDNSKYRLVMSSPSAYLLGNDVNVDGKAYHVRIDGLQLWKQGGSNVNAIAIGFLSNPTSGDWEISNNILRGYSDADYPAIFIGANSPSTYGIDARIWNNIIYDWPNSNWGAGIYTANDMSHTVYIYNNTIYNTYIGLLTTTGSYSNGRMLAKNNIIANIFDPYYDTSGFVSGTDYNFTSGNETPGVGSNNKANQAFKFVSTASSTNPDLHLRVGDSVARSAGANLTSDVYLPLTSDVDMQNRPQTGSWDIGADEVARTTQINTPITNRMKDSSLVLDMSFNGVDMNWASTTAEALDRSGYNNNGNVINASGVESDPKPKPAIGINGQALKFDPISQDQWIEIPNSSSLNTLTTYFTVMAWVKRDARAMGTYDGIYTSGTTGWQFFISNSAYFSIDDTYYSTDVIADTNWHQVAVVKNGNSGTNLTFYLDGAADGTASAGSLTAPSGSKHIGNLADTGGPFGGLIDEVRAYNRALSASEIKQLYQYGVARMKVNVPETKAGAQGGLVLNMTFNGQDINWASTTAEALDRSGQNNNGDATNMSPNTAAVSGISGQALKFDGVDDYVGIGHKSYFTQAPLTASAWVKFNQLCVAKGESEVIISKTHASPPYDSWYLLCDNDLFNFYIYDNVPAWHGLESNSAIVVGQWYYVVGTIDASYNAKLYVNGVLQTDTENVGSLYNATDQLRIGAYDGTQQRTNGLIDEVRIYNRVLSVGEIMDLYRVGARRVKPTQ